MRETKAHEKQIINLVSELTGAKQTCERATQQAEKHSTAISDLRERLDAERTIIQGLNRRILDADTKFDTASAAIQQQQQIVSKELNQAQETLDVQRSELETWKTAPPHHAADTRMIMSLEREKQSLSADLELIK